MGLFYFIKQLPTSCFPLGIYLGKSNYSVTHGRRTAGHRKLRFFWLGFFSRAEINTNENVSPWLRRRHPPIVGSTPEPSRHYATLPHNLVSRTSSAASPNLQRRISTNTPNSSYQKSNGRRFNMQLKKGGWRNIHTCIVYYGTLLSVIKSGKVSSGYNVNRSIRQDWEEQYRSGISILGKFTLLMINVVPQCHFMASQKYKDNKDPVFKIF